MGLVINKIKISSFRKNTKHPLAVTLALSWNIDGIDRHCNADIEKGRPAQHN